MNKYFLIIIALTATSIIASDWQNKLFGRFFRHPHVQNFTHAVIQDLKNENDFQIKDCDCCRMQLEKDYDEIDFALKKKFGGIDTIDLEERLYQFLQNSSHRNTVLERLTKLKIEDEKELPVELQWLRASHETYFNCLETMHKAPSAKMAFAPVRKYFKSNNHSDSDFDACSKHLFDIMCRCYDDQQKVSHNQGQRSCFITMKNDEKINVLTETSFIKKKMHYKHGHATSLYIVTLEDDIYGQCDQKTVSTIPIFCSNRLCGGLDGSIMHESICHEPLDENQKKACCHVNEQSHCYIDKKLLNEQYKLIGLKGNKALYIRHTPYPESNIKYQNVYGCTLI